MNIFGERSGIFPITKAVCIVFGVAADLECQLCRMNGAGAIAYHCHECKAEEHENEEYFTRSPWKISEYLIVLYEGTHSQNSLSPYARTAKRLMIAYSTIQPATTAATGMSSLQKVRTKFSADISNGIKTAS